LLSSFSRSPTKPQIESSFIASELKAVIYTESREDLFAPMSESARRMIHIKPSCSKASLASFFLVWLKSQWITYFSIIQRLQLTRSFCARIDNCQKSAFYCLKLSVSKASDRPILATVPNTHTAILSHTTISSWIR
jgi:hypothetical protein